MKKDSKHSSIKRPPPKKQKDFFEVLGQKWKSILILIVAFAIGRVLIDKFSPLPEDDVVNKDLTIKPTDYQIKTLNGEKHYFINNKLKKQAHPNSGIHQKRSNKTEEIDPFWIGKEETLVKVAEIFNSFNEIPMSVPVHFEGRISYKQPHLSIINDPKYCIKSDAYHIKYPASIFDNYFILTDFGQEELPREAIGSYGVDVLPKISQSMSTQDFQQRKTQIPLETALIHSRISRMHHFHKFNTNLFCTYQSANHIPGKWSVTGKDLVIDNYRQYQKKPFRDLEKCWKHVTFMPESYRLYDERECKQFFSFLESQEYKEIIDRDGIAFILKEGRDIHRGDGISLISPSYKQILQNEYQNGKRCGINKEVKYVNNPILHEGKKIEVRIYFFIASTSPLIIYAQKLALLKKCSNNYDKFDYTMQTHVCNTSISKKVLDDFVVEFALEGLQEYLLQTEFTKDPKWLENTIYPQIYRAIIHLVRGGEHDFLRDPRVNENFAVDFLIDDQSKVWFLENNPNPQVLRSSAKRTMRHFTMFGDLFEIQFAYLRSRAKRLNKLAQEIAEDLESQEPFQKKKYLNTFKNANDNFLEPEFAEEIREDSSYIKIYDETLKGDQIFMGNLPEDCLYQ